MNQPKHNYEDLDILIGDLRINIIFDNGFFKPGGISETLHNHIFYEIHYIINESCEILSDIKKYRLSKHNLCLIPPLLYHYTAKIRELPIKYCIRFTYGKIKKKTDDSLYDEFDKTLNGVDGIIVLRKSREFGMLLDEIYREYSLSEYGSIPLIQSLLTQFFIRLYRTLVRKSMDGKMIIKSGSRTNMSRASVAELSGDNKRPGHSKEYRDYKIETFFQENIARSLKVDDLAEELHLSVKQTNRILKDFYGHTFKQKLIEERLSQAKQLLGNASLSIDRIAESIGYNSKTGFYIAFKKNCGMTPDTYRKAKHI
ncbi:MAG: AraC family transcriptional regulator [Eubacteriales bacterium]